MKPLWAVPDVDKTGTGLLVNPQYLIARDEKYQQRLKEKGDSSCERPMPGAGESGRWAPLHADIQDASELYAYLSPEVRRFAIAMQSRLSEPGCLVALCSSPNGRPAEDRAQQTPGWARPRVIYNRMLAEARKLMEAAAHSGVTDRLTNPLAHDHPDFNPRRVVNVLREAVNVGCHLLLIADVCGAFGLPDED